MQYGSKLKEEEVTLKQQHDELLITSKTSSTRSNRNMNVIKNFSSNIMIAERSESEQQQVPLTTESMSKKPNGVWVSQAERQSIRISLILLSWIFAGYKYYAPDSIFTQLLGLQYKINNAPPENEYGIGLSDIYVIMTLVLFLSLLRSLLVEFALKPLAYHRFGIKSHKSQQRYGEQGWSLIYYSFSWALGFYLYWHSPYFLNCEHIFRGWPHDYMSKLFKFYYLLQISSWVQQIIVLNMEERRKDYWQMFAHHIITVALTTGSYYYHFTRIGHVILIIMDVVDILLAKAKLLKYCGFSNACDYVFVLFLIFWAVLRHGAYNYLFYYTWAYTGELMQESRCDKIVENAVTKSRCWTPAVINTFLVFLAGLQIITIIWLFLIVKVLIKVIKGTGAEDVRSDDED